MTLVLTEISEFGVVMIADTAETRDVTASSGKVYTRVHFGTPKLFPIHSLRGGVSFWGAGEIYDMSARSSRIPTDVWLEDFVAVSKFQNLDEFAHTLRRNVNNLLGPEASQLGFQVAGINADGHPVFYRVSNYDSKGVQRGEFSVDTESQFPRLDASSKLFADGDSRLFKELDRRLHTDAPLPTKPGHPIPPHTLEGRAEHYAAWVRFVSDLYQSAGLLRTIGGTVTTVRIDPNGAVMVMP